jgi:putative DNA primase/helicase
VVPFEVVTPEAEQDPKLNEKLELEANAVLGWLLQGWQEYDRDGLQEPDEVTEATWKYRQDSDSYARFVAEQCVKGVMPQRKKSLEGHRPTAG